MEVEKSNPLEKFPILGPDFKVEATLSVTQFDSNHRRNVFRLTRTNGDYDYEDTSDRLPAIWLNEDHQLEICYSLPENKLFCKMYKVEIGKSYHLTVEQKDNNLSFIVNDETIISMDNPSPEVFKDVSLYTSDPWSLAFTKDYGTLENIVVSAVTLSNTTNFCTDGLPGEVIDNLKKGEEDKARSDFCLLSDENKRKIFSCPKLNGTMISLLMTPDVYCGNSLSWGEQEDEDFFIYGGIQNDLNAVCDDYCQELREEAERQIELALKGSLDNFNSEIKNYTDAAKKFTSISKILLNTFKEWNGGDAGDFRSKMEKEFRFNFGKDWETGQYKDGIKRIRDTFEADLSAGSDLASAKARVGQKMTEQLEVSF